MAPRDNQELVPLTDGSGHANDDELEAQHQKKPHAGDQPYDRDDAREQLLQQEPPGDMLKSLLGCQMIVGMGTLWRFPYVCLKYGGGTFLIPYMVVMCLVGYPLLIMEIGIGQKLRHSSLTIWTTINPQLGGIGIVICLVTIGMACYYGIVIAWCFKYMVDIQKFHNLWPQSDPKRSQTFWHKTVLNVSSSMDESSEIQKNQALPLFLIWLGIALMLAMTVWISHKTNIYKQVFAIFSNSLLHIFPYFCYFTMFMYHGAPFLLVVVYIVQSGYGYISFLYITSIELKDLLVLQIWVDAVIQVFCSLGLVHGSWTSFGSLSKRKSNFLLTATMVVSCSFILVFVWTWFIVSTIIPNVLQDIKTCVIGSAYKWDNSKGMPAHVFYSNNYDALIASRKLDNTLMNFDVQECNMENQFKLASNGIGLVFTALEQFASSFPLGKLFGYNNQIKVPFNFPQLYCFSLCSASLVYTLKWFTWALTEVEFFKKMSRFCISIMLCILCCICGLVFTTRTGVYWLSLYNEIFINSCLTVLALCEVLIVVFIYGYKQFLLDIYDMTGHTISRLSIFIWRHITPMLLILTFSSILTIGILDGFRYEVWTHRSNFLTKTRYPYWAQLLVWAITAVCLLLILAFCMVDSRQNLSVKFKESLSKVKKTTGGHIKRSDTGLSGKGIITEIDFDDCPDSENDEELDNSAAQVPVRMYKIEVLDSWKSARGQVYL